MSNDSLSDAILSAGKGVTGGWKRAKKREDRISQSSLARLRMSPPRVSIKEAAFNVMAQAYNKASSDGRYYANARQIMYAARPLVLKQTDGKIWKDSNYFTQTLLKDYLEEYGSNWKVVWDARGHLHEPHTGRTVDLGGIKVMEYTNGWRDSFDVDPYLDASDQIQTTGPALRYGTALFIEKEGFAPILEAAGISERYDLALVSSKGLPVAAACKLLRTLQNAGVKILVMRDFDLAGFKIVRTLRRGVRLSVGVPDAIDIGFRLDDVADLESEPVEYKQDLDPRIYLREAGATEDEANFLVEGWRHGGWYGERVELNAMTSEQILEWLEAKLEEHGVEKLVPDDDTLERAYQRAVGRDRAQEAIEKVTRDLDAVKAPEGLADLVREHLDENATDTWEEAVAAVMENTETGGDIS